MKHKSIIIFAILFALITTQDAHSQWVQTNGPYGGRVYSFAKQNGKVFAATNNGVYSLKKGDSIWIETSIGIQNTTIDHLASNGTTLFASTGTQLFSSSNGGVSWQLTKTFSQKIFSLFMDGSIIYVGTFYESFKSSDLGVTWVYIDLKGDRDGIQTFSKFGKELYVSGRDSIYVSVDSGQNWKSLISRMGVKSLAVKDSDMYIGTSGNGALHFHKSFGIWNQTSISLPNRFVYSMYILGKNVYAGTDKGIYLLKDTSTTWLSLTNGMTLGNVNTLFYSDSILYAGKSDGVLITSDSGASWRSYNKGIISTIVHSLTRNNTYIFAATYGNGIFRSSDEGDHWEHVSNGLTSPDIQTVFPFGDRLFAGSLGSGAFRSDDQGLTWIPMQINGNFKNIYAFGLLGKNLFASIYYDGVFRSTDQGSSWARVDSGLNSVQIVVLTTIGKKLYAGTTAEGIFTTLKEGTRWDFLDALSPATIFSIVSNHSNIFVGTNQGMFKSTDDGIQWTTTFNSKPSVYLGTIILKNGNNVLIGTDTSGIYFSYDEAETWIAESPGLPIITVASITQTSNNVFASTNGKGVWKRSNNDLSVPRVYENTSTNLTTSPNPLAHTTTINFVTRDVSQVKVSVYDLLGKEIAVLFNGLLESGEHSYLWNASTLPQGMYHCVVRIGTETKEIPMVVVR